MKKILIIDESSLIRDYLSAKLSSLGLETIKAINGLDGMIKIRNSDPDLIIMDNFLSRKSVKDILKDKASDPNVAAIPIILLSLKVGQVNMKVLEKFNIKRILTKPLKIDLLFTAIAEILNWKMEMDPDPCIIEAHFNTDILFIEIARGLNRDKLELLKYKIRELKALYKFPRPKTLLIISDIPGDEVPEEKLRFLLDTVIMETGTPLKGIKVLTTSESIKEFLKSQRDYKGITSPPSLEKALNSLLGIKLTDFIDEGKNIVKEDFIINTDAPPLDQTLQLRFGRDEEIINALDLDQEEGNVHIAIVDDDDFVHKLIKTSFQGLDWQIASYANGKTFLSDLSFKNFDVVFLDLMMPELNGFKVLEYLNSNQINLPVIILSSLTHTETITRAFESGVKSYMMKPLDMDNILLKTRGLLAQNF